MQKNTILQHNKPVSAGVVFCLSWVVLFILYFPAAKAGFVADFTGWLDQVSNHSFAEHINRTNYNARSLYQFTQLATWVFYKLFGINAWLWHLLFITMHAVNAALIYKLVSNLLKDTGAANISVAPLWGVLFFCVSPYMSEAVVWEPAFHFIQGLIFILLILVCVQRFIYTGLKKYALLGAGIYILSLFTLEIFYLTPWLVLVLALFYRNVTEDGKKIFIQVTTYFFMPLLLLFVLRFTAYWMVTGSFVSRISTNTVSDIKFESFGKPIKYLFHLLLMGRFFPDNIRHIVYDACDSAGAIMAFYSIGILIGVYILLKFRSMSAKAKVASLLFVYTMITLAFFVPLYFYDIHLVIFDRYAYFTAAFLYMLLAVAASFISMRLLRLGVLGVFTLVNLRFAIKVVRYWNKSSRMVDVLIHNIPDAGNRKMLMLNIPENMNGIAMIGSDVPSEFKLMHDLLITPKITNTVYDVQSYNLLTPDDGAHVNVLNDSTVRVTLNQWGTWWWYKNRGGMSYENEDYKLNLRDPGHYYELTLKKSQREYILLYQVGSQWKAVDMSKKDVDQN